MRVEQHGNQHEHVAEENRGYTLLPTHFPGTYGSSYNWLILSALILSGAITAKLVYYS